MEQQVFEFEGTANSATESRKTLSAISASADNREIAGTAQRWADAGVNLKTLLAIWLAKFQKSMITLLSYSFSFRIFTPRLSMRWKMSHFVLPLGAPENVTRLGKKVQ